LMGGWEWLPLAPQRHVFWARQADGNRAGLFILTACIHSLCALQNTRSFEVGPAGCHNFSCSALDDVRPERESSLPGFRPGTAASYEREQMQDRAPALMRGFHYMPACRTTSAPTSCVTMACHVEVGRSRCGAWCSTSSRIAPSRALSRMPVHS
jgi:hypothetical protein